MRHEEAEDVTHESAELSVPVSIEIRCPVYLHYAKSRKRFIPCGQLSW
jgi:hypothetical protein